MSGFHQTNYPPSMVPIAGSEATKIISTTAVSLDAGAIAHRTLLVRVQVQGADVRYTLDGSTPTASVGFLAVDKEVLLLSVSAATAAKFIRDASTDATLRSLCLK